MVASVIRVRVPIVPMPIRAVAVIAGAAFVEAIAAAIVGARNADQGRQVLRPRIAEAAFPPT